MSQKSDPQAVSVFTEGQFAKRGEKGQVLCLEIWASTAKEALEDEIGSTHVPICGLPFGLSRLRPVKKANTS